MMVFMASLWLAVLSLQAQVEVWNVIAKAPRDMQTEKYGKAEPLDLQIIRDGNRQVLVDTARYVVTEVNRSIDTDSIHSVEFTTQDWRGDEYIIKFNHDLYAESPLMRHCVIFFAATKPYDWTYYFCKELVAGDEE